MNKIKELILLAIEKEIEFCKTDKRKNEFRTNGYKQGFIKGLAQAQFLINHIEIEE